MSNCFRLVCLLHSGMAVMSGLVIIFHFNDKAEASAKKVLGSTPHDELLIRTTESLAGMCFVIIGMLLFMVSFVEDTEFHSFFAKGCVAVYVLMAAWRLVFERQVVGFAADWPRKLVGDALLALSWIFFLIWDWKEKYD